MELDEVAGAGSAPLSVSGTEKVVVEQSADSQQISQEISADLKTLLANDPRLAKFNLVVSCDTESSGGDQVHGKQVVLRNGKLYLDDPNPANRRFADGHPFSGFYLEYAFEHKPPPMGLVSTISKDPPMLNWIYVDKDTLELKYGNRSQSALHIVGPWDWTDDRSGVTLEGWEGFVALEETEGTWVLCYDLQDDHLKSIGAQGRLVECSLDRKLLK